MHRFIFHRCRLCGTRSPPACHRLRPIRLAVQSVRKRPSSASRSSRAASHSALLTAGPSRSFRPVADHWPTWRLNLRLCNLFFKLLNKLHSPAQLQRLHFHALPRPHLPVALLQFFRSAGSFAGATKLPPAHSLSSLSLLLLSLVYLHGCFLESRSISTVFDALSSTGLQRINNRNNEIMAMPFRIQKTHSQSIQADQLGLCAINLTSPAWRRPAKTGRAAHPIKTVGRLSAARVRIVGFDNLKIWFDMKDKRQFFFTTMSVEQCDRSIGKLETRASTPFTAHR